MHVQNAYALEKLLELNYNTRKWRLLLNSLFFCVILMYYFSLIPNISFTIPLKHFGTFFTTIFIFSTLLLVEFTCIYHLHVNHASPIITMAIPMTNNQPDIGSNKTSNMPRPNPIKQTPIVFFNAHNIKYYLLFNIILNLL